MNGLQSLSFNITSVQGSASIDTSLLGILIPIIVAFFMIFLIFAIAIYVYSSFAFMAIAKKAKMGSGGIAWIPIVGKPLIASKIAKMHWWPVLLLLAGFLPVVGIFATIAFAVFYLIWVYKTLETVGKPGWWALLILIPFVGVFVYLILLGIVAWSKK